MSEKVRKIEDNPEALAASLEVLDLLVAKKMHPRHCMDACLGALVTIGYAGGMSKKTMIENVTGSIEVTYEAMAAADAERKGRSS